MANLNDFNFTQDSDVVATFNDPIENNTLVKTLNGDDSIESIRDSEYEGFVSSIFNGSSGIINMGSGNDSLIGEKEFSEFGRNKGILNRGTIIMGQGNDFIQGSGELFGIDNVRGIIRTGIGNDSIEGIGEAFGIDNTRGIIDTGSGIDSLAGISEAFGIDNARGTINTGDGDDSIEGIARDGSFSSSTGIDNTFGGIIRTGQGDDSIEGTGEDNGIDNTRGTIRTGVGNDLITGKALPGQENDSDDIGITNSRTIITGAGNDTVFGIVESDNDDEFFVRQGTAIINNGKIAMGDGDDFLNGEKGDSGIINDGEIDMGNGHDSIEGTSSSDIGIINNETIITGDGNDTIIGDIEVFSGLGIVNEGTIEMGKGDDSLVGRGDGRFVSSGLGIINEGAIEMGEGNDSVIGASGAEGIAIDNQGTISTDNGNDSIGGSGLIINDGTIITGNGNDTLSTFSIGTGIDNSGLIDMGAGDDFLSADSADTGVFNSDTINMGAGNDSLIRLGNNGTVNMGVGEDLVVIDEFNSFGEQGFINLGRGDDAIEGFGEQTVDGGAGFDTAKFDFTDIDDLDIAVINDNSLVLETRFDGDMTFTNVESFKFGDLYLSFEELSTLNTLDFDEGNLAAGTIVTNQFKGVEFSTSSPFGLMIFDTNNPTGGDDDLLAFERNALIISEDGDSSDPDDNADGGTISVDFDNLVTVNSLELLDIDQPGGSIELFDDNSNLIETIEIPALGDGRLQKINLDVENVASLDINLAASGALTNLTFFESSDDSTIV